MSLHSARANWSNLGRRSSPVWIARAREERTGAERIVGGRSVPFPGESPSRIFRAEKRAAAGVRGAATRVTRADVGPSGNKNPAAGLPGIEWAIEDTVNIQPRFPVATVRRKNGARGAREDIDAGVRRLPHSAPTSKLGVYTWQSRHFGVSIRLRGFIFTHAHGVHGSAAGRRYSRARRDLSATHRKPIPSAVGHELAGPDDQLIRQISATAPIVVASESARSQPSAMCRLGRDFPGARIRINPPRNARLVGVPTCRPMTQRFQSSYWPLRTRDPYGPYVTDGPVRMIRSLMA